MTDELLLLPQTGPHRSIEPGSPESAGSIDPSTGLIDRAAVMALVNERLAVDPKRRIAVLFLDLNGFKGVNDAYGHAAGDHLLTTVAERISDTIGADDVASRLGGDEFLVVTSEQTQADAATDLGRRLAAAISRPAQLGQVTVHPRASIGVALPQSEFDDADALVEAADLAMYEAKRAPFLDRPRVVLASEHSRRRFERRRRLAADFGPAWRAGGISHRYQPVRRLQTLEVLGAESFLVWNHPDVGPATLDELLRIAATPEHIVSFTTWALRTMTHEWASMRRRYPRFDDKGVAFNVDARQLLLPGYVDLHLNALDQVGLRLDDVIVEVQGWDGAHRDEIRAALVRITDAGIPLALDLFGVGHNALEFVQYVPIAGMKFAREMISPLVRSDAQVANSSRAILEGLVHTSRQLHADTLAEGVESAPELAACREVGIRCAMGPRFGRPAPIEEFEQRERRLEQALRAEPSLAALDQVLSSDSG